MGYRINAFLHPKNEETYKKKYKWHFTRVKIAITRFYEHSSSNFFKDNINFEDFSFFVAILNLLSNGYPVVKNLSIADVIDLF